MSTSDLKQSFRKYFRVILADTPELRQEVFRIRYQVYCRELGYERAEDFPEQLESDIFDVRSYHCLLMHRPSGTFAGCVRLVLNDPYNIHAPLPFEKHCRGNLYDSVADTILAQRNGCGEISRLAVTADFRRRTGDSVSSVGEMTSIEQLEGKRKFPYIPLGLYLAAAAAGLEEGLDGVFAMMEPRLARHLQRFGIVFQQAGDIIEHRGQRAAYYIDRDGLYNNIQQPVGDLLESILNDIGTALKTGTY